MDYAFRANGVDLAGLDDLETAIAVIVVVARSGQGRADAGMNVGIVREEPLFMCVEEVGAMVDGGLFARGAAKDLGAPGVSYEGLEALRVGYLTDSPSKRATYRWLSKWTTLIGPYARFTLLRRGRVMV